MRLWVGVTDPDWFAFLSRAGVDEVNFWQPSATAPFVGLEPGAPFLFKLKRPYNHIAGAGRSSNSPRYPCRSPGRCSKGRTARNLAKRSGR